MRESGRKGFRKIGVSPGCFALTGTVYRIIPNPHNEILKKKVNPFH